MKKTVVVLIALALLGGAVAVVAGCGGSGLRAGAEIPADTAVVGIAEINEKPTAYAGKSVVTSGYYGIGLCSDCFLIKDGVATLRVEGSQTVPVPSKSYLNKPLRVYGTVDVTEGAGGTEQAITLKAEGLEFQ
ncbi:MAG: hypothetical protein KKF41_14120 [Actinobacteria bacterium]|nr:hypothetical protein [Actinomycetota bacterium]MBU1942615.1 hypothetical protein [Actinomycetota bacterium]MBU2688709.1 hypothetical protein [Actinomycetota bacterium]